MLAETDHIGMLTKDIVKPASASDSSNTAADGVQSPSLDSTGTATEQ